MQKQKVEKTIILTIFIIKKRTQYMGSFFDYLISIIFLLIFLKHRYNHKYMIRKKTKEKRKLK
jgi:hypothetical protein